VPGDRVSSFERNSDSTGSGAFAVAIARRDRRRRLVYPELRRGAARTLEPGWFSVREFLAKLRAHVPGKPRHAQQIFDFTPRQASH